MSDHRPGELVLVEIPYTDLSGSKKRPGFVVSTHKDDILVAFITSRLEKAGSEDVILKRSETNGLVVDSAVLTRKIFTLHRTLILRTLGACQVEERRRIIQTIIRHLQRGL